MVKLQGSCSWNYHHAKRTASAPGTPRIREGLNTEAFEGLIQMLPITVLKRISV